MNDAWFFVGVFGFIFLLWIATGGPSRPLAFAGPTLAQPGELGGGTYLSLPKAPFSIEGGSNVSLPGSSYGGGTIGSNFPVPVLTGSTFGNPSPYRGMVTLNHSVSNPGAANPANETLQIYVASDASVPVDITGWRLVSEATGASAAIPKGTEVPTSGIVNTVQDLVLKAGDRATISSGYSPIGGSFRENKCIGYFSSFQQFTPSLPMNCPAPRDELATYYGAGYLRDASCMDYIDKLSRCQVALTPPPSASGGCQAFIVKYLNYNGCMEAHQGDADFLGNSWRVYLGRTKSLWRSSHELVKLLDAQGNTVDAFTY